MESDMPTEKQKKIRELEKLAAEVLSLKQERDLRRPLLIEFCGSPKAGKSTTINALNIFLKRNEFKTVVLTERASVCPIRNKTDPSFNIWTLTSAVAEILKNLEQGTGNIDIIISDRGVFDALCWFDWLNKNPSRSNPHLDDKSFSRLREFILLDLWQTSLDLVYVFKVKPKTSITREYANLLTEKRGSIMDEPQLASFNDAISRVITEHGGRFRDVKEIETDTERTDRKPDTVSYEVTAEVLHYLQDLLVEKIGYFEDGLKKRLAPGWSAPSVLARPKLLFGNRNKVEADNKIQPIPIAVITNPARTKVLVTKKSVKRTSKESPERNRLLLWIGGHVRLEDKKVDAGKHNGLPSNLDTFERTLHREIKEEIGESLSARGQLPFLIYTPTTLVSKRHFGVCYVIEMDLEDKKFKLVSDEFVEKKGTSESGHVFDISKILSKSDQLEEWSILILEHVFGKKILRDRTLFDEEVL
jgi:predicted NUDIX family phosphoesterase